MIHNMSFTIKKATRTGIIPFITFFGLSSGGKTHSALLFARGMVGPNGKIGVIDTENGRASILADVIPGGFSTLNMEPPFSPDRFCKALNEFSGKCDVLVIDSGSALWIGEGGVLEQHEMALDKMLGPKADDWRERERMNWTAWNKPKTAYKMFVQKALRYPVPVILCLRAKIQTKMVKDERSRNTVQTSEHPVPDFDPKFIFESTIAAEVYQKDGVCGMLRVIKRTRDEILKFLPTGNEQVGSKHGEMLAAWCAASSADAPTQTEPSKSDIASLKKQLWELTKPKHGGDKSILIQWLVDECILDPDVTLEGMTCNQLEAVINAAKRSYEPSISKR